MKRLFLLLLMAVGFACAQNNSTESDDIVVVGNPAHTWAPNKRATIQDALDLAGPTGVVIVPSSYTGTEALTSLSNPHNILILDFRGGLFQTYPPLTGGSSGGGSQPFTSASIAPTSLPFGTVQVGTDSQAQPLAISNNGNIPFTVTGVNFPAGSKFSATATPNPCLGSMLGGATCVFLAKYHPSAAVSDNSTVTVTTNAAPPADSLTVTMSGSGNAGPTFLLAANTAGLGSGTIVSNEATPLINCTGNPPNPPSGQCQANYAVGATPILTVTPAGGSTLTSFTVGGTPCASPCTVTVNAATQVTATFALTPPNFNLAIQGAGQGTGSVGSDVPTIGGLGVLSCTSTAGVVTSGGTAGCGGLFAQGTVVTLTAVAVANSTFVSWSGVSGCATALNCVITVNSNVTVTANFSTTAAAPPSLVQTSTNCSVSGSTVACPWASPQIAGDFNVCAIGIPDATTTVSSVVDSKGNTYTQVPTISPKVGTNLTQALYYSQNIQPATGGSNTTTATLSSSVATAISGANLTSGNLSVGGPSFVTASITPTANRLVMIVVNAALGSGNGPGPISSITQASLTWHKASAVNYGATAGTANARRMEVWYSMTSSPSAGAVTITFGTSPNVSWSISQFSGVDTSGVDGAGAIGIVVPNGSGTSSVASPASITMGTFGSAANGTYAAFADADATTMTAGSPLTGLGTVSISPGVIDEWNAGNVSPVTATYSGTNFWGGIGVELKAAGASGRRDMRCAEYSGVKQSGSPIDASAAATGTSAAPASGNVVVGTANDLLTGWLLSSTSQNTVSSGFTQRIKNSFGDDLEDQQGVATGTYNYQPTLTSSGNWVDSHVAWLAQTGSAPTVFSLSLVGAGNGGGTVTGNTGTPAINCVMSNSVCTGPTSSAVSSGTTVVLTAAPAPGSVFAGWTGITGCASSAICTVPNITSSQSITATFTISAGQNYYINGSTGSDSNSGLCPVAGTPAGCTGPWLTINKVNSGVTLGPGGSCAPTSGWDPVVTGIGACVHVKDGLTYPAVQNITTSGQSGKKIRIICEAKRGCKFTNGITTNGSFIDVVGFELDGTGNPGLQNGFVNWGSDVLYRMNYAHDVASGCASVSTAVMESAQAHAAGHGTTFDSNLVAHNNCGAGHGGTFTGNSNSGISTHAGDTLVNNIVVDQGIGYAVQISHDAAGGMVMTNNVIAGNDCGAIIGFSSGNITNGTFSNNIIANNGGLCHNGGLRVQQCGAGSIYQNNLLYGNNPTDYVFDSGCSNTSTASQTGTNASVFVNYTGTAAGDYHLKTGSPAIDHGTTTCASGIVGCMSLIDADSISRPIGPALDIGPFEFH